LGEGAEGLEERHDPGVAEAQRGDALAGLDGGTLQTVERLLRQDAVVTDPFHLEQLAWERHHASIMEFENFSSVKADADNRQADLKRTTPVDAHAVLR
jgi:hypothetical protein